MNSPLRGSFYKKGTHLPLAILIEQGHSESISAGSIGSVTNYFKELIEQKAAATLVSKKVMFNFMERKRFWNSAKHPENKQLQSVNFYNNEFDLYELSDSQFFLVIPQSKVTQYQDAINLAKLTKINLPDTSDPDPYAVILEGMLSKSTGWGKVNDDDWTGGRYVVQRSFSIKDIQELFSKNTTTDIVWDVFVCGHGNPGTIGNSIIKEEETIASLKPADMQDLLKFFTQHVTTGVFIILSCYAGGTNFQYLSFKKEIKNPTFFALPNFPIIVQGVDDTIVQIGKQDFNMIFSKAAALGDGSAKDLAGLMERLTKIDKSGGVSIHGSSSIPQIILPGGRLIQSLVPQKQIKVIGNVYAKTQEIEGSIIDIKSGVSTVLLYPNVVKASISVQSTENTSISEENKKDHWLYLPAFSELINRERNNIWDFVWTERRSFPVLNRVGDSPILNKTWLAPRDNTQLYPEIISMIHGDAVHYIANITCNQKPENREFGVLNFIRDAFHDLNGRETKKTFIIGRLSGPNDLSPLLEVARAIKKNTTQLEIEPIIQKKSTLLLERVIIQTSGAWLTDWTTGKYNSVIKTHITFMIGNTAWGFKYDGTPSKIKPDLKSEHWPIISKVLDILKYYNVMRQDQLDFWSFEKINSDEHTARYFENLASVLEKSSGGSSEQQKSISNVLKEKQAKILPNKDEKAD